MGFRDDGDAMLARIAALERELAASRAELAEYKARYEGKIASPPKPEAISEPGARTIVFRIREPGAETRDLTLSQAVIKIGKLGSSHIRLNDDTASRMHAVIECDDDAVHIIDLGSTTGTCVNGKKVNKASLRHGDHIRIGESELVIAMRD
jgi:pSer/pThr/pTyr-binding forkhead associated (FHA) protein